MYKYNSSSASPQYYSNVVSQSASEKQKSSTLTFCLLNFKEYRNDPKSLDRQAWTNSADPDRMSVRSIRTVTIALYILYEYVSRIVIKQIRFYFV